MGEVLPQQAIRIFVGAALPGTLRVTKIDLHPGRKGESFMLGQFHPAIPGQRSPQGHR